MKKIIIATSILFLSAMASANSGQADRLNESRSYPNKAQIKTESQTHYIKSEKEHTNIGRGQ